MILVGLLLGCGSGDSDPGLPPSDLDMRAENFPCLLEMTSTGRYRYTNLLDNIEGTEAVARSETGGTFPVGTVIQLIPTEAMVKRAAGWNPATQDWEFFTLDVTGGQNTITARGGVEVENSFNGSSCFGCHAAAEPQWDLVCGADHGCADLGVSQDTIQAIQAMDPRCN